MKLCAKKLMTLLSKRERADVVVDGGRTRDRKLSFGLRQARVRLRAM